MKTDTNARIAERLRNLSSGDRDWLLGALAPEECRLVSAALRAHREQTPAEALPVGRKIRPDLQPAEEPVERLDAASPQEIAGILGPLPDWAMALVLAMHPWRWAQAYLDEHTPERVRALRALALELECVKPAVRSALLSLLVAQLEPPAPKSPASHNFDAALERAMERLSIPELRLHRGVERL
jgi:hypothetical protein